MSVEKGPRVEGQSFEGAHDKEKIFEGARENRGGILRDFFTSSVLNNRLDETPIVRGGKKVAEAIAGADLQGGGLDGKQRIIHAAVGAGSLVMDITGVDENSEVVVGKSVGWVSKLGGMFAQRGMDKVARILARTAEFMEAHPTLTRDIEGYLDMQVKAAIRDVEGYKGSSEADTKA